MPQRWPVSLFSPKVSVILRVVNKPLDYAEMVYIKHLPYEHLQYAPPLEIWTQCYVCVGVILLSDPIRSCGLYIHTLQGFSTGNVCVSCDVLHLQNQGA